jgi:hypothetical protein
MVAHYSVALSLQLMDKENANVAIDFVELTYRKANVTE